MHSKSTHQINIVGRLISNWGGTTILGALLLALVSCGGTGGDSLAGGGIGGTGIISVGAITGLGSIYVNGIKFETDMATVTMDGMSADQTQLQIGMVVTVNGTLNADGITGIADFVDYDDSVEGPIASIDLVNNDFIVLGQRVHVDNSTVYDNLPTGAQGLPDLLVGDLVEVSGFPALDGSLIATRVEYQNENGEVEITGFVSNPGANQFFINNQEIVTTGAEFENFQGRLIMTDDFVEVKGTYDAGSGAIIAAKVINRNVHYQDDGELEISGFIKSVGGIGFTLTTPAGNQRVDYNQNTEFEHGTENDLMVGREVKVEGYISGNVLIAEEISFEDTDDSSEEDDESSESEEHDEEEE